MFRVIFGTTHKIGNGSRQIAVFAPNTTNTLRTWKLGPSQPLIHMKHWGRGAIHRSLPVCWSLSPQKALFIAMLSVTAGHEPDPGD